MKSKNNKEVVFEIAAEVCYQIGGIYRVIHSKVPQMLKWYGDRYCLIGPYLPMDYSNIFSEFVDEADYESAIGRTVKAMKQDGIDVRFGRWMVDGLKPAVVLINPYHVSSHINSIRDSILQIYGHFVSADDFMADKVLHFGHYTQCFFETYLNFSESTDVVAHFHEYNASYGLVAIKEKNLNIKTVFTTHATVLGRHLATFDKSFFTNLPQLDVAKHEKELPAHQRFPFLLERLCTNACDVFTTVSDTLAAECIIILKRMPEIITRNGLNAEGFDNVLAADNKRDARKHLINFARKYFRMSEEELQQTRVIFTSGRYEYQNKGFDILVKALSIVKEEIRKQKLPLRIACFFVSTHPYVRSGIFSIIGNQLLHFLTRRFFATRRPHIPFDEHWIYNHCELLNDLKSSGLNNAVDDVVKVVFHPRFVTPEGAGIQLDYFSFVAGCDLAIFPSYYEPWGYTPAESISIGTPTIMSNVSGLAHYLMQMQPSEISNVSFIDRYGSSAAASKQLATMLLNDLTAPANAAPKRDLFDWSRFIESYRQAYTLAINKHRDRAMPESVAAIDSVIR